MCGHYSLHSYSLRLYSWLCDTKDTSFGLYLLHSGGAPCPLSQFEILQVESWSDENPMIQIYRIQVLTLQYVCTICLRGQSQHYINTYIQGWVVLFTFTLWLTANKGCVLLTVAPNWSWRLHEKLEQQIVIGNDYTVSFMAKEKMRTWEHQTSNTNQQWN